ncbi:MAG TPA: hypothetical protein VFC78_07065 [Tepidisphaeraceae bacterium]|nr:hypothetical protein [Tepidisphaeraceae bacterium]
MWNGGSGGIGSGTFSGLEIGCGGAILFTLFTIAGILGILAMAWWTVLKH